MESSSGLRPDQSSPRNRPGDGFPDCNVKIYCSGVELSPNARRDRHTTIGSPCVASSAGWTERVMPQHGGPVSKEYLTMSSDLVFYTSLLKAYSQTRSPSIIRLLPKTLCHKGLVFAHLLSASLSSKPALRNRISSSPSQSLKDNFDNDANQERLEKFPHQMELALVHLLKVIHVVFEIDTNRLSQHLHPR